MSLKDTFKNLRELLTNITTDLEKSENGNKAASQRVRTGTVKLEKLAKVFRKESIVNEKKTKGQKKSTKAPAAKKIASNAPTASSTKAKAPAPAAPTKAKAPAAKAKTATLKAKPAAKSTR